MTTAGLNLTLSLNDIALDPSKAQVLSPNQAQDLLCKVSGLIPVLLARTSQSGGDSRPAEEEFITVKQAAEILNMSTDWIYRNKAILPFVVKIGGSIRINRTKLNKHMKESQMC